MTVAFWLVISTDFTENVGNRKSTTLKGLMTHIDIPQDFKGLMTHIDLPQDFGKKVDELRPSCIDVRRAPSKLLLFQ